jgi:hypothetical protein
MYCQGKSAHILAKQEQGPPSRLLNYTVSSGCKWRDNINRLSNVGHSNVTCLSNEDIEPRRNCKGIRKSISFCIQVSSCWPSRFSNSLLLRSLIPRGSFWIPYVPLIETDQRSGDSMGHLVFDSRHIDKSCRYLNGSFCRSWCWAESASEF